ncbi:hypothetical protein EMUCRT_0788 [Ehrlichia cf. muris str. EmCRT]|uniref:Uncharacterized protein n=1 Tax=Ehrlichia cf. muris str. EmCRT TaxID=1359167 RepID=A0A0F3N6I3_9RICK|nr:hypothetical protein EMUCRT_0788 [Ehrlichia cf. muris str. EmCRT]
MKLKYLKQVLKILSEIKGRDFMNMRYKVNVEHIVLRK